MLSDRHHLGTEPKHEARGVLQPCVWMVDDTGLEPVASGM